VSIEKVGISEGPAGIAQTLVYMRDLVVESDAHREVKETAVEIIRGIDPNDYRAQVKAVVDWVRNHVDYVKDIHGVEEIQAPHVHLAAIKEKGKSYGDCDDFAVLESALLRAIGFQTRLEALAVGADRYNHARMAVFTGPNSEDWLAIEGTQKCDIGERYASELDVMFIEPVG